MVSRCWGGEEVCRSAELFCAGANVDGVDVCGVMANQLHGHALGDSCGLEKGGYGGAEAVEGFAVPDSAVPTGIFSAESDTERSNESGEFRTRIGMSVQARQHPDSSFPASFLSLTMFLLRPSVEPFLHGLAEGTGCFACNDSDGAGGEVELFPLEVTYVSKSLSECAYAAADGRGPFIR